MYTRKIFILIFLLNYNTSRFFCDFKRTFNDYKYEILSIKQKLSQRFGIDIGWGFLTINKTQPYLLEKNLFLKNFKEKSAIDAQQTLTPEKKQQLINQITHNYFNFYFSSLPMEIKSNQEKLQEPFQKWSIFLEIKRAIIQAIDITKFDKDHLPNIDQVINIQFNDYLNFLKEFNEKKENLSKELKDKNAFSPKAMAFFYEDPFNLFVFRHMESSLNKISFLDTNPDGYRHPLGKLYLQLSITKQNFLGYTELFENDIVLNLLTSSSIYFDPYLPFHHHLNNFIGGHILWGLQVPELLTILPSSGLMYMKIFLSGGLLLDFQSIKTVVGLTFLLGFGDYGYVKIEILYDFHDILELTIEKLKTFWEFLSNLFSALFVSVPTGKNLFERDHWVSTMIFSVSFFLGKNTDTRTALTRYLSKKHKENLQKYKNQQVIKNNQVLVQLSKVN